jgi:TolA-binding protein
MKVVDLHPEELIDRLAAGELTPAERERLDAHLLQCSVCRFELDVRGDFEQEMPAFEQRPQLTLPGESERTRLPGPAAHVSVSRSSRPRSGRRWPLAMMAAALLLCAGGAAAAVLSGAVQPHWLPWVPEAKVALAMPAATPVKAASKAKRTASKPAVSSEAESVASAEESAPSLPPARVEQPVAPASVGVSALAAANRVTKFAPVTAGNARAAASVPPANALPTSEGANSRLETASRVAPAPSRLDPAAALFADANRARRDGNADRAVSLYRALQSRYPSSAESALSRALLAQLLLDRGSPEAALSGFDRYLAADAPVLNAEALVGRARALEQLGKSAQAAAAWRDVQSRFPGSVHARLAATRLAALGMR